VFSVEKVDERLQEGLDVVAAVVAELHEEVK